MLEGFERKSMLTERAHKIWEKRLKEIQENNLNPYDGHDTVGAITLDQKGTMTAGTSSSGLFMKNRGGSVIPHYLDQAFTWTVKSAGQPRRV